MMDDPPPVPAAATPQAAQRRYLTMLFSDLSESTRLAAAMEAENYAELLDRLRAVYREVIPRHGGTIVQIQGDGILAVFGYPDAREDNGRRATEAALELHDSVRGLRLERPARGLPALELHTGIHAGLVLFGEGDLVRGKFELLGDATNVASHLADVAQSDEILVSESTLGPESHFFQTSERLHLDLKGRDGPLAVFRILARAAVSTRFEARARRGLAPFVGRRSEMQVLVQSLRGTMAGRPEYWAIAAPAGLGKTRLAEEFLGRAATAGCPVYRGFCESYLGATPLQPFLQILRSLFRLSHGMSIADAAGSISEALSSINADLLRHRPELLRIMSLGAPESAAAEKTRQAAERTILVLRDLFDQMAAQAPLLLFIDDWQWADDATRKVLGAIRSLDRPILVLLATRGFEAGDAAMTAAGILELAPLTQDEAAETIGRLLPATDPFLATAIWRYSGGNPLFIEELCHSAAHDGGGRRLGEMPGGATWLDSLIQSRVARLPERQAEIVRAAAVIGTVVPCWLLESITGCAESDPMLRELAARDLVFPGEEPGMLRFKHGITRDVIYSSVGLRQRQAMHLRIVESLRRKESPGDREEIYEALAYHYGAGGRSVEAAEFAELAGDKAMAASALDRAQSQYRAALAALDRLEPEEANRRRWSSVAQKLGLACVFDPSRDQLDVQRRAVELAAARGDEAALARAEYWLGYIHFALGESRTAIRHSERALAAARRVGDDPLAVQIVASLGQARAAACDYEGALRLLDEAIEVKRRHRSGARPAVGSAYALAVKASVLGDRGLFGQAHECFREALDAVRGAGHAVEGSVLSWQSGVLLWQGRWDEALQCAADAQRIAERVKSLYVFAMSRALGAYAHWMIHRAPESIRTIADATSWLQARDRGLLMSLNHGWLADGLTTSGRYAEARAHAARALMRARKRDRLGEAMACRALARAAAAGQQGKSAGHYLARAMNAARARDSRHEAAVTWLCHAGIEADLGRRSEALHLLDQAAADFESMGMAWHLEEAARVRRSL